MTYDKLQHLDLSNCQLSSWYDQIVPLSTWFPSLSCLRLSNNPLLKGMTQGEARTIILGRVKNIRRLNGAAVNQKERIESEKAYLRKILREMKSMKSSSSSNSSSETA